MNKNHCPLCSSKKARKGKSIPLGFKTRVCARCSLEYMVPRPTMKELEEIYTESYYEAWNLKQVTDEVYRLKSSTSSEHLRYLDNYCKKGKVLDVGCATGFFLMTAQKNGWDPYGVELSDFAAAEAKKEIGEDRIFNGQVEQCDFEYASFNAVTMMDCIEHVLDINGVMKATHRLLKPGGCVLMTTPFVGSFTYNRMGQRWTHYKNEHIQYFSQKAMNYLLKKHGFEVLYLKGAKKHLNIDYFVHQFERYQHPVITPLSRTFSKLTPSVLRYKSIPLLLGDMLVIGRKIK